MKREKLLIKLAEKLELYEKKNFEEHPKNQRIANSKREFEGQIVLLGSDCYENGGFTLVYGEKVEKPTNFQGYYAKRKDIIKKAEEIKENGKEM